MALKAGKPWTSKAVKILDWHWGGKGAWRILNLVDLDGTYYTHMVGSTYQGQLARAINDQELIGAHIIIKFGINGQISSMEKL